MSEIKVLKIDTNNHGSVITLPDAKYKTLKGLTGCMMEMVHPMGLREGLVMMVDEEGLLKGLSLNLAGSYFYQTHIHGQPIVGDVYFFREFMGRDGWELAGLRDDDMAYIKEELGERVVWS